jgi:hypothetical protein
MGLQGGGGQAAGNGRLKKLPDLRLRDLVRGQVRVFDGLFNLQVPLEKLQRLYFQHLLPGARRRWSYSYAGQHPQERQPDVVRRSDAEVRGWLDLEGRQSPEEALAKVFVAVGGGFIGPGE